MATAAKFRIDVAIHDLLRSGDMSYSCAKSRCSEAFVQLLGNQNFYGLPYRRTPITGANNAASCRFAIFHPTPKWPDQSILARL